MSFRGTHEHSVDAKGRTSLPARLRDELNRLGESRLVITMALDTRTLVAYPLRAWEDFEERLAALPSFDADVIALKRRYVAPAVECDIDKLGRLLLPAKLRDYAQITRDIVFAGMGKYIEIWDAAQYASVVEAPMSDEQRVNVGKRMAELKL